MLVGGDRAARAAYWPTKGNRQNIFLHCVCIFLVPEINIWNAPKRIRSFFLLIRILSTFWADQILILWIVIFDLCGFQISIFPGSKISIPVAEEILQQNGWGLTREFGNLGNLGSKKIPEIQILKIKIRVAQNVSKVWISRKNPPDPLLYHFRTIFP